MLPPGERGRCRLRAPPVAGAGLGRCYARNAGPDPPRPAASSSSPSSLRRQGEQRQPRRHFGPGRSVSAPGWGLAEGLGPQLPSGGAARLCPPAARPHKSSCLIPAPRDAPLSLGPTKSRGPICSALCQRCSPSPSHPPPPRPPLLVRAARVLCAFLLWGAAGRSPGQQSRFPVVRPPRRSRGTPSAQRQARPTAGPRDGRWPEGRRRGRCRENY